MNETKSEPELADTQALDLGEIVAGEPGSRSSGEHAADREAADGQRAPDTPPAGAAPALAEPEPRIQSLPMVKALNAGLRQALAADPTVLILGEDVGPLGGVFRVTEGLQSEFGASRVVDTPLAEAGIVGTAIGLAMRGYRPVLEIQFNGFVFPGFDQITTQLAKMANRHGGKISMPVVIRIPHGGHIGAVEHHQEAPEAYFAHTAGLRIAAPSTPHDAYWMIQEAIASDDPVIFFEPMSRYWPKGEVDTLENPVPLHASRVVRTGTDATIVAWAGMVPVALRAAEIAAEEGRSLEVVDLRSLAPIDYAPVLRSVQKTGRLVVAQEAPGTVSVGSEVAAVVGEKAFYSLEAPVLRVAGFDTPFPPAKLEGLYLPDADRILEAVDRSLAY
ncbi:pyruvate dehydrogenase E1 component subunit beta [Leifsonia xyli subsp. cynodontis DSM 46306]|uniref:Transketolase-like pyrimidine-binding domain-containing protein n=2 Tax=Leifsonia xyli TaxID=1575 RepID=U3PG59_LEIXC|nr:pyruvate dehydrogenase E1 component subunit beta [Leifsonia xyli subsp. cynodontis DSM 46306]